ncbi:MAG: OmpA family protein [Leptospiraceae bacterium]|nr:OmpA family protein [Leptospiraceae bacterium]MDW8306547.1 OmpA family protein [Leptospiraceae bacterium]
MGKRLEFLKKIPLIGPKNQISRLHMKIIPLSIGLPLLVTTQISPEKLQKKPLSPVINSKYDELAPVLSVDGQYLYFCREGHPDNKGYSKRKDDQDIWVSQRSETGEWLPPERIEAPFNSESYDFPIHASADNETLYIGNIYEPDGSVRPGVSKVSKKKGRWGWPQALIIEDYYNNAGLVNYSMGVDERTLILNLQRDDTHGKMDLYVSFLRRDGTWSAPRNLGPQINSGYSEVTPFLAADMKTLYFASNRPGGYGGFDMYVSRRLDDSWVNWSEPVNLGPEINTQGNDISYVIAPTGEYAIFSSDTEKNGKDLFQVTLPESVRPDSSFVLNALIVDENNKPVEASIQIDDLKTRKNIHRARSQPSSGEFKVSLPVNKIYSLRVEKEGYLPISLNINLTEKQLYPEQSVVLQLKPMKKGSTVELRNIFFGYNSAELSEESYLELDRLRSILETNPKMKIEIGGHTDNIGTDQFNLALSQRRAEAVRDYLIKKGIAPERIIAKGYGASRPVASNSTEAGRAKNRRVVFTILSLD